MDKNELRKRIEEVAIIKDNKPARSSGERASEEWITEIDENGNEVQIKVPLKLENPTLGFKLVKLKPIKKECSLGCGDVVSNQIIEKRLSHYPRAHWKTKCMNCGCFLSPCGKYFLENSVAAQAAFVRYLNGKEASPQKDKVAPNELEPSSEKDYEIIVHNEPSQRKGTWVKDPAGNIQYYDEFNNKE